jgi:hypothetical protein
MTIPAVTAPLGPSGSNEGVACWSGLGRGAASTGEATIALSRTSTVWVVPAEGGSNGLMTLALEAQGPALTAAWSGA